jgi:hypothetical protein
VSVPVDCIVDRIATTHTQLCSNMIAFSLASKYDIRDGRPETAKLAHCAPRQMYGPHLIEESKSSALAALNVS